VRVQYIPPRQFGAIINTPGQILNAMNVVDRLVDSLGISVNAQRAQLPKNIVTQFEAFWNEWKAFYSANKGLGSRLWEGTYEQTVAYQGRAADWQKRLAKAGADVTPDSPSSDKPLPSDPMKILTYVGIGTVAIITLFTIGKLVHTVVLGEAMDEELLKAEKEALRIARGRQSSRSRGTSG
jgi:hypothetical protein